MLVSVNLVKVDPTQRCGGNTNVEYFLPCRRRRLPNWCVHCRFCVLDTMFVFDGRMGSMVCSPFFYFSFH